MRKLPMFNDAIVFSSEFDCSVRTKAFQGQISKFADFVVLRMAGSETSLQSRKDVFA